MTHHRSVIQHIVALAKLPGARCRREIERELRDHLEDLDEEARSRGHNKVMVERIAAIHLGDPREIAAAFASVYAFERWMRRAVACAILLFASFAAVSLAVGIVQSTAALWIGTQFPDVSNGLCWEILGVVAIALGYCSAYVGQRLFPTSFARAVSLSLILTICVAAGLFLAVSAHAILLCVAFAGAAIARLLQRLHIPFVWLVGTAGPITIMALAFRPPLPGQGPPPWLLWVGLTLSCAVMRRVVNLFEKLAFEGILA